MTSMNEGMTNSQLRQRRARFLRDQAKEHDAKQEIGKNAKAGNDAASTYFMRLYLVVGTAVIVTFAAFLNHTRPKFLFGSPTKLRPFRLSSIYPPGLKIDSELPRFFRTYSIATPQNEFARLAVKRSVDSRKVLRQRSGGSKILVKTWDAATVTRLIDKNICGADFEGVYSISSEERKNDLMIWCIISVTKSEGFFLNSVQLIESPLLLTKKKGIVVKSAGYTNSLSMDFYLHPRNGTLDDEMAIIPSRFLRWMMEHKESDALVYSEYRRKAQEHLHELVFSDSNEENYLIFEEVCQERQPPRAISRKCEESISCCYIVVPEKYGGRMFDDGDSED